MVAQEDDKNSCSDNNSRHSSSCQDDSHCLIKRQEVNFARNTGRVTRVGPELNRTSPALMGTWEDHTGKATKKWEESLTASKDINQHYCSVTVSFVSWNTLIEGLLSITSLIADLSISTGDTVKAADRLSFPIGSSGSWGAARTAYRNRHLKIVINTISKV